jgi:RNA polymerase sigma-70 factor (ECF subfamily)
MSRSPLSRHEPPSDAEPRTLRDLFLAYRSDLLGYLMRKVGPNEAPDLLQETFVRVIRHDKLETIADPPAFLKQIAVNLVRDFVRRRRSDENCLEFGNYLVEVPSEEASIEERMEYDRNSRLLQAAVDALPPRCRQVFVMHVYDDIPLREVAERMDISDRMVRKHLSLAFRACRAALKSAVE